jgi:hypothetical protein
MATGIVEGCAAAIHDDDDDTRMPVIHDDHNRFIILKYNSLGFVSGVCFQLLRRSLG